LHLENIPKRRMERNIFEAKLWMRITPNLVCSIYIACNNYSIKLDLNKLTSMNAFAKLCAYFWNCYTHFVSKPITFRKDVKIT